MNELITQLTPSLVAIAVTLLTALSGWLGVTLNAYLASKKNAVKEAQVRDIIGDSVSYVEQVFKTLGGADKLQKAKETVLKLLAEQGLVISETQLNIMIESTVNEFYAHYNEKIPVIEITPIETVTDPTTLK